MTEAYGTAEHGHMQAMADYHHGTRMTKWDFLHYSCTEEFVDSYERTYDHHVEQLGSPADA